MATDFIYTTSLRLRRPVFIDAEKLESLDKLLDEESARLSKRNEANLNEKVEDTLRQPIYVERTTDRVRTEALKRGLDTRQRRQNNQEHPTESGEEELQSIRDTIRQQLREEVKARLLTSTYSDYREERSLTIHLKKNKRVVAKSFGEAFRQPSLIDEKPIGFEAGFKSGDITCNIELRSSGSLDITVSPEHLPESRELFAALLRWATPIRPPFWQQLIVILNPLHWAIWLVVVLIAANVVGSSKDTAKRTYQEQAKQLLIDGLSQDEQVKALETILALQSEFVPATPPSAEPGWFLILFYGGSLACLALSFTPSSHIGIGKGEQRIKYWRRWLRVLFIIVPSFIFVNVLWPYISKLFGL